MKPGFFVCSVLFITPLSAVAITNIESQHSNKQQQGLEGSLELSVRGKSGNSDKQTSSFAGQINYLAGSHQHLTLLASEYGESRDQKDTDNSFVHQRYIYHSSETVAYESFLQYQDDAFKLLESRMLAGAGLRIKLSPADQSYYLNAGMGAYYTEEIYNISNSTDLRDDYARANFYVNSAFDVSETATISNTFYWQPRFSKPSDSYLYNTLSLSVKINELLALKLKLETQYDSDPVNNLEHTDHSYYTSLEFSF